MKYLYITLLALVLMACSGSPGSSDIKKSLASELAESCPYVNISNVKTTNIISPNSNNDNIKEVSFSADVQVKLDGEVADRWRSIEHAKKLFEEHHDKLIKASLTRDPDIKRLEEASKIIWSGMYHPSSIKYGTKEEIQASKAKLANDWQQQWAKQDIYPIELMPLENDTLNDDEIKTNKAREVRGAFEREISLRSYGLESEQSKKYADMSNGVLKLTTIGSTNLFRLVEPKHVNMPDGCLSYNGNTILGIITQEAAKRKNNYWEAFIDGVSVGVEGKRTMVKSSNGWVFR